MKTTFSSLLKLLQEVLFRYDELSNLQKCDCLKQLSNSALPQNYLLEKYNNTLIFICAHPSNLEILETPTMKTAYTKRYRFIAVAIL